MAMSKAEMDRLLDEHFRYEVADDVEGVVATLAPDVVHDIVGSPGGPTIGRDNARPFYERLFADLADGCVTPLKRLYGDRFIVDESLWKGRAVGQPFGMQGRGRPLEFRLLHVVEFAPTGQIQRENVWIDLAAIAQQLGPASHT